MTTQEKPKIGVVGVGRMGANIALRLKDVGYPIVAVYDNRAEAAEAAADQTGAERATSLARRGDCRGASADLARVPDSDAKRAVLEVCSGASQQ